MNVLNFDYSGPIDGHDINMLLAGTRTFKVRFVAKTPSYYHHQGQGFEKAEENQVTYHSPGKFDKRTGELQKNPE